MTRDLFRRYVWLVDTVKNGKRMTFDQISHAWDISSFNVDGSKLALRTFHNHREAIELLFGIRILCNRSDHHYYIAEETSELTNLKLWMLQSLSFDHLVKLEGKDVENRIIVDETPGEKFGLITVIDAMKRGRAIAFRYPSGDAADGETVVTEPIALRYLDNTWFVLGRDRESGKFRMFRLPYISEMQITKDAFKFPDHFTASEFFGKFIGLPCDTMRQPEIVKLRVKGDVRGDIKAKPFHKSQREISAGPDSSVFELEGVPTDDFLGRLISMGDGVEILAPESLREEMERKLKTVGKIY